MKPTIVGGSYLFGHLESVEAVLIISALTSPHQQLLQTFERPSKTSVHCSTLPCLRAHSDKLSALWEELERAAADKGEKLREASEGQQFFRMVKDVDLWLDEVEQQLQSDDVGKVAPPCLLTVSTLPVTPPLPPFSPPLLLPPPPFSSPAPPPSPPPPSPSPPHRTWPGYRSSRRGWVYWRTTSPCTRNRSTPSLPRCTASWRLATLTRRRSRRDRKHS